MEGASSFWALPPGDSREKGNVEHKQRGEEKNHPEIPLWYNL